MAKVVNIKFVKHPVQFRMAYFPGDIISIDEKQADELVLSGVAVPCEKGSDLPDDIPGRNLLINAGLSLSDVKEISDFTQIKGISKTTAANIVKYLKKLQQ